MYTLGTHITVTHSGVLSSQAVHPQNQHVLAIVSGDGELALHSVFMVYVTTTTHKTQREPEFPLMTREPPEARDPLQPVP